MKPSRYNHLIRRRSRPQLLYNCVRRSFLPLDQVQAAIYGGLQMPITRNLMNFNDPAVEQTMQLLTDGGFLAEEQADEMQELELASNLFRFSSRRLDLWIGLTTRCDQNCPGCPHHEKPRDLGPQAIGAIKDLVLEHSDLREISVTFWGGEPSLAWPLALEMKEWLDKACRELNAHAVYHVITNGGPGHLPAIVRDKQNRPDLLFINLGSGETVNDPSLRTVYLTSLAGMEENRNKLLPSAAVKVIPGKPSEKLCRNLTGFCQSAPRFSDDETDILKGLVNSGFEILNLPRPKPLCCQAADPQSFIVDPEGNIYKCWNDVGRTENRINEKMNDPFSPQLFKWMAWNPYRQQHCRICGLLPWCLGGCLAQPPDEDCGLWHYSRSDILKLLALEHEKRTK
ncbi:SPASM domain-containing protein [candidate division TA06 bacterium]|nr:SPASM domain-containing protein [candidate division TA06 bacterium]